MEETQTHPDTIGPPEERTHTVLAAATEATRASIETVTNHEKETASFVAGLQRFIAENPDLAPLVWEESYRAGTTILSEGETSTTVYLLIKGDVAISKANVQGKDQQLATLQSPNLFGEISSFAGERTATASAHNDVKILAMDPRVLRQYLGSSPTRTGNFRSIVTERLLGQRAVTDEGVGLLTELRMAQLGQEGKFGTILAAAEKLEVGQPGTLLRASAEPKEKIMTAGEHLDDVYMIQSGTATVQLSDGTRVTVGTGSPLGEIAALSETGIATATVVANERLQLFKIPRNAFRTMLQTAGALTTAEALANERLSEQYKAPLPVEAQETLRTIRDQNIDALMLREALVMAHSSKGIFSQINPQAVAIGHQGVVEQKYNIITAVDYFLRAGWTRETIETKAQEICSKCGNDPTKANEEFQKAAETVLVQWKEQAFEQFNPNDKERVPSPLSKDQFSILVDRFERGRWLENMLRNDGALGPNDPSVLLVSSTLHGDLGKFLAGKEKLEPPAIFNALDAVFVQLMEIGLTKGSPKLLNDLSTVKFEKVLPTLKISDDLDLKGQGLELTHTNYTYLRDTRERLKKEKSAIGGSDYATQRFPQELLERIANGKVHVVVYTGTKEAGLSYIRRKYSPDKDIGIKAQCMTTEVQGLDGSGGRTLVTFLKDGSQVLLVCGYGESRQLHNAGSILLYEGKQLDEQGQPCRLPEKNLELASEGLPYEEIMQKAMQDKLESDAQTKSDVLGVTQEAFATMPTELLILQNPKELRQAYGEQLIEMSVATGSMFEFYIAYVRDDDGTLRRLIVPKVGGKGLYGDTAGTFITAAFHAVPNLAPDVVFNGTAGGFAKTKEQFAKHGVRGVGDVKPGGLLMPKSVRQHGEEQVIPLREIFATCGEDGIPTHPDERELYQALVEAGVEITDNHIVVPAPAVETYDMINKDFVEKGLAASVDVEGASCAKAVKELNEEHTKLGLPEITFRPLYTHSDDPRASEKHKFDSLALLGPLFEGSRFNDKPWQVLKKLLAFLRKKRSGLPQL